ncbi:hypothetical protein KKF38_00440 [Patescibacteria group bacterium]|nr:hypothetical protein [Patescibacteria group bacterium]
MVNECVWEERLCFPDLEENFTYTLAMVSRGLSCAHELIPNKKWEQASKEMKQILENKFRNNFYRSFGKLDDTRMDASLLGLVFPSGIINAKDKRMKKTVKLIEKDLVKDGGLHRYENDEYDGWMWKKKRIARKEVDIGLCLISG